MKQLLFVFLGGGVGSVLRFLVSKYTNKWLMLGGFPIGTLLVNLLGCFAIGYFTAYFLKNESDVKFLLIAGFCGGFTTFSSFTNENFLLLQNGQYLTALIYIGGSIIIGILAVFAGFLIANQL